jgi:PAS domain S-box-containing protein
VKAPGILYRVSFLVLLNSLFIFATVTYVSIENNHAKIDRLLGYRFDYVGKFFRAQLDDMKQAAPGNAFTATDSLMADMLRHSQPYMKGLAGLAVLVPDEASDGYRRQAQALADNLATINDDDRGRIISRADRTALETKGIHIGPRFSTAAGDLKTVYIPWEERNPGLILAITFLPEPIVGSDADYNYILIVLFLSITLITLLTINFLFLKYIKPLSHLTLGMEKTIEGEVQYKIENVRNDEIGRVATAFNTMSDALWDQRRQLLTSNVSLTSVNQKLTDALNELSEANTSLAESEAYLSRLIENSPMAVVATDPDRNIRIFSRTAAEMFGLSVEAAQGRDIIGFFPFAPEKVFPPDEQGAAVIEVEMICRKDGGESFPAFVTRVPIMEDSDTVRAYLLILRDISESKGFQEMMISIDRMVTRGIMAGEVAHEINNYLAVILGNVELIPMIMAKGDMARVEKKLEVLKNSVARIQRFSEGLVGYGNEEAVFELGDLNQNIENLVAFLKPQNRYDGVAFEMALSRYLPLVHFDSSQIQQMLINLLNNAADALREKSFDRVIRITTEAVEAGQAARISIADNAGGLPTDLPEIIFKSRYNGRRRGRGFGLMVVKQILDRHQGTIEFETAAGQGTTFRVTLPVRNMAVESEASEVGADQVPA